ncbi:MAG: M23 family metallopeptidase [Erysipelotrichaceae bacterium]|nr:M23 family metallopeptidase [Erysipelotrichaceae bacterium]MDY5252802.1 M23 family metallopeptidase [Erysipelotrichaceae bacterium]
MQHTKRKIILLVGVLLMSVSGVNAESLFINPIEDGEVVREFDEKKGYRRIAISDEDITKANVRVSCDGKVKNIDKRLNGTYDVTIEHDDGYLSMYIDMGEVNYAVGSEVKQGDTLGKVKDNMDYLEFVIIKDNVRLENTKELITENNDSTLKN